MNLYLVRVTNPNRPDIAPRYKSGLTKWGKDKIVEERFYKFGDFEGLVVELLCVKYISHVNAYTAREMCVRMEQKIFEAIPKKAISAIDNLEEYFDITPRAESFGCTEFHHKDLSGGIDRLVFEDTLMTKWTTVTGGKRHIGQQA
jgi:hypothetical protein